MLERKEGRPVPANLSEERPAPTIEQARQAVREGNEMIDRLLEEAKKKVPNTDEDFHKAMIVI